MINRGLCLFIAQWTARIWPVAMVHFYPSIQRLCNTIKICWKFKHIICPFLTQNFEVRPTGWGIMCQKRSPFWVASRLNWSGPRSFGPAIESWISIIFVRTVINKQLARVFYILWQCRDHYTIQLDLKFYTVEPVREVFLFNLHLLCLRPLATLQLEHSCLPWSW